MFKKTLVSVVLLISIFSMTMGAFAQDMNPKKGNISLEGDFVPDQLLIQFQPWTRSNQVSQILSERGVSELRSIRALGIRVLQLPPGLTVEKAIEVFSHLPEVEFVEPNYIIQIADADPGLPNQWAPQWIEAPQAWEMNTGDPSVTIAVVDTGIDYRHSELNPNMWEHGEIAGNGIDDDGNGWIDDVYGWDFVSNDSDPIDDHFHGTHVAGIAAASLEGDSSGMAGICPNCSLMAVKVLSSAGTGTLDAAANGITYAADNGAKVINLSLSASAGTATLESAVNYAWNHGVVVVAAAGNDAGNISVYPAAYANAMAIASTNSSDFRSCFSNYGEDYISVAAPGEAIYSTTLVDGSGQDTYGTYSGTSMATPHAAGLAGLIFSSDLNLTNDDVRTRLESTSEDLGPVGFDPYFGHGRINVLRAVNNDTSPTTPPDGNFTSELSASGYAHARKLVRDSNDRLHWVWHSAEDGMYKVLYAHSDNDGTTWSNPEIIFSSSSETYHPAVAIDESNIYVAYPTRDGSSVYRIFFSIKPLSGGSWSAPQIITASSYNAVRPDLYYDPIGDRVHLAASSLDDSSNVYYANFSPSVGVSGTWSEVLQVNVDSSGGENSRYADVHANGDQVFLTGRTVKFTFFGLLPEFRVFSIRSLNAGENWQDLSVLAVHGGFLSGEYGTSMSGRGEQLALAYEHNGTIMLRQSSAGVNWSTEEGIGSGAWPTITQGSDGDAWLMWESDGTLHQRHYTGTSWDPDEAIGPGNYPNLKSGVSGSRVEWVSTHCSGAPYRLNYGFTSLEPNQSPVANPGSPYSGTEDLFVVFDGTGSYDPNGDPLTYTWDFGDGSMGEGPTPSHTYLYGGTFTVTLTISDDKGASDTSSTSASIAEVNDAPVADANGPYSGAVGEDILFDGSNSSDYDNMDGTIANDQSLEYSWDFGDGSNGSGVSTQHPYESSGEYTVTIFVYDGIETVSAQTTVSITQPNQAPTAGDVTASGEEDAIIHWTPNVSDPDLEDVLTCVIVDSSSHGIASVSNDCSQGTYTPFENFNGGDSFTYRAFDGSLYSEPAIVTVSIEPVNDPPSAGDVTASGNEDTTISWTPAVTDPDIGDSQTCVIVSLPSNGTANVSSNCSQSTYTPGANFYGNDTFTYRSNDGTADSNIASVTVVVHPINDPPAAVGSSIFGNEDMNIQWTPDVKDIDSTGWTCEIVTPPISGEVIFSADCSQSTYSPDENFNGSDHFTYKANDGSLDSNIASVAVTVYPVNDPPTASFEVSCVNLACDFDASNSSDPEDVVLSYLWDFGDSSQGSTEVAPSHTYVQAGTYTISLTVTDSEDLSDGSTQEITVSEVTPSMHVGDLDGSTSSRKTKWAAEVTIYVVDWTEQWVKDANVLGEWSGDIGGQASCITNKKGNCTIRTGNMNILNGWVTFEVLDISHSSGWEYRPDANHDPDGESDGTTILLLLNP